MATDLELFAAWRGGDAAAGSELFERHARSVLRFFRNKVGDGTAEDLLQETFLSCVQASDGFRGDAEFRTYLFTAARSRLHNYLGRVAPKRALVDFGVDSVEALGLSPTAALAQRDDERALLHALRKLPIDLQTAIELFYFEGIGGEQLAQILGVARPTARRWLQRARDELRGHLEAAGQSLEQIESHTGGVSRWADELRADRVPDED